jgi:hypothetical protein
MFVHETERMRPVAEDDDDTTHGTGTATPTSIMMQGHFKRVFAPTTSVLSDIFYRVALRPSQTEKRHPCDIPIENPTLFPGCVAQIKMREFLTVPQQEMVKRLGVRRVQPREEIPQLFL